MAVAEGTGVDVYYNATQTSFTDAASVMTFVGSATAIPNVTDLGAIERTVNIIEFPVYGEDVAQKTVGLDTPGDFTMDIAFDPGDSTHVALASSDVGKEAGISLAVKVSDGSTDMYFGMSGIVSSASMGAPVDGVSTLSITVALEDQIVSGTA